MSSVIGPNSCYARLAIRCAHRESLASAPRIQARRAGGWRSVYTYIYVVRYTSCPSCLYLHEPVAEHCSTRCRVYERSGRYISSRLARSRHVNNSTANTSSSFYFGRFARRFWRLDASPRARRFPNKSVLSFGLQLGLYARNLNWNLTMSIILR